MQVDASEIVSDLLRQLKERQRDGGMVCCDFTDGHPLVSDLVHKVFVSRGYTALIALGGGEGPATRRMYIAVGSRRKDPKPAKDKS